MERKNLWAPWRIGYIRGLAEKSDCFICHNWNNPEDDDKSIVMLNRFPYNNGHMLIAPARHIPDLEQASEQELLETTKLIRESQKALSEAISPHGYNIGMNFEYFFK